jgi:hypothetical protein
MRRTSQKIRVQVTDEEKLFIAAYRRASPDTQAAVQALASCLGELRRQHDVIYALIATLIPATPRARKAGAR